jgi:hypothetical protein
MDALSPAATFVYDKLNAATSPAELDQILDAIWRLHWPRGELSSTEAQYLTEAVERRKPRRGTIAAQPISKLQGRLSSRFTPRPCRRRLSSEERTKRRHRKRMLGGSSAMPDTLRGHYTEGERAALCIVAFEIKQRGFCDRSIDEIAVRAGVGRTTVQNALHQGGFLGMSTSRSDRREVQRISPMLSGLFPRTGYRGSDEVLRRHAVWIGSKFPKM